MSPLLIAYVKNLLFNKVMARILENKAGVICDLRNGFFS